MSVDEFETYLDRQRRESSLDHYKQTIIAWLREYPTLSAAQVCDWLKEHYSEDYSERTVSRYVKKLRQECKVSVYMCRGADPESKGKIENTVKYIKGNFLRNRMYVDDSILNCSCLDWLERTANKKVHGTRKRVPAEVFQEEREYLRPLVTADLAEEPHICRTV